MILRKIGLFLTLATVCVCFVCSCDDDDKATKEEPEYTEPDEGDPIRVVDGKVRLYVSEASGSARASLPIDSRSWNRSTVMVNGKEYTIYGTTSGKYYVQVDEASDGKYEATLTTSGSGDWYGSSIYSELKVPYSQFYNTTVSKLTSYPMFASYSEATGNRLLFGDGFGILDIALSANAEIASVKVEDLGGGLIAGKGDYTSDGGLKITSGLDFAVLNCTNNGSFATLSDKGHFYMIMAPGTYSSGLKITVCDSKHLASFHTTGSLTVTANEMTSVDVSHNPDSDLMYYEGFDLFVWGGNIVGGAGTVAYAPTSDKVTFETFLDRDGYADAYAEVDYNVPGSPYIQSDNFDDVDGETVLTSHQITDSYMYSRNIQDYNYLYRVSEFQGYVGIGVGPENGGKNARGRFWTTDLTNIDDVCTLSIDFDFCWDYGIGDDLVTCITTGFVTSVTVDGTSYDYESSYAFTGKEGGSFLLDHSLISAPASNSEAKSWHHVVVNVSHASSGARVYLYPNSSSTSINHGCYVDNIEVRKLSGRAKNTVRLLYWNIQNGMWADQRYNYDRFVEWVKMYDPDICVWNEAQSIYEDYSGDSLSSADRFLPSGWVNVAYRYGHEYVSIGSWHDNYPQEITSKYPITKIEELYNTDVSGSPLCHGASVQSITVNGTEVHFVTLHLWPQSYGYGVSTSDRTASTNANEGDYYRLHEITYLVDNTINGSKYSSQKNWIMLGDFNSKSRLDDWYYKHGDSSTKLLTQSYILDNTDLVDVIGRLFEGYFVRTWNDTSDSRIDFVYNSPTMDAKVVNATVLEDAWTRHVLDWSNPSGTNFYDPSDHYPILVDYEF